ncbi:MAG: CoA-binding protein [Myxococcales bacterium]
MNVAILGISSNPTRYAYRAAQRLLEKGHSVFGINPKLPKLEHVTVVAQVSELPANVHTLSVYVSPEKSLGLLAAIAQYGFSRVIFNPGSEQPALARELAQAGVEVVEACTLVMLSTGRF